MKSYDLTKGEGPRPPAPPRRLTKKEWMAEGYHRYGPMIDKWQFRCPGCNGIQTAQDFKDLGIDPEKKFWFTCIRHWAPASSRMRCDTTLGGVMVLHKTEVIQDDRTIHPVFEWATEEIIRRPRTERV